MATTIRQSFADYKSNLEIRDRQTSLVSEMRGNVADVLQKRLTLHKERSKVIGSWDRHTMTRRLSEADVDVMVVLHYSENKSWLDADGTVKALDRFRSILTDAYPKTTIRRDRNCITMQFSEFRLDVVPAFKYDPGFYKIPDSIRRTWVRTDPIRFQEAITEVNKNMDGTFIPLIKMVKGWNRNVGWPLRSFHLECLLYSHYRYYTQSYTYDSTLKKFFGNLPNMLRVSAYDPIEFDQVDTYLDNNAVTTKRDIAIGKAERAASYSEIAYGYSQRNEVESAIRSWKTLFGEFFPSYG